MEMTKNSDRVMAHVVKAGGWILKVATCFPKEIR